MHHTPVGSGGNDRRQS